MGFYCEYCRIRNSIINSRCSKCGNGNLKYGIEELI
jgi:ribosomal protein L40E